MTTEPEPGPDPRSPVRSVILGAVGFAATLVLLLGFASLISQGAGSGAAFARPGAHPTPRPRRACCPELLGLPTASVAVPTSGPTASGVAPGASPPRSPTPSWSARATSPTARLDDDAQTAALVAAIPGTVFTAGDNAYENGSAGQFRDCYDPTWGAFKDRTRPAAGNHDWETKDLAGYLGYFGEAAAPHGVSWYSYELGAWHVIVLDSDCSTVGGCGAELAAGSLAARPTSRVEGDMHARDLASPAVQLRVPRQRRRGRPVLGALYAAGADVVINGHDHDYERFAPQDPDGRDRIRRGASASSSSAPAARPCGPSRTGQANSQLRLATSHGIIRFDLRKDLVRLDVHADHGLRDRFREGPVSLTDQARVVVIGGGITGCSVAYHLAAGRLDGRAPRREGAADRRLDLPGGRARDGLQPVVHDDGLPALQHRAVSTASAPSRPSAACAWRRARSSSGSSSGRPAGRAGSGSMRASSGRTRLAA